MKRSKGVIAVGLVAGLNLVPAIASACPACAGRDGNGMAYLIMLGGMILLPFAVAGVTGYALWRNANKT